MRLYLYVCKITLKIWYSFITKLLKILFFILVFHRHSCHTWIIDSILMGHWHRLSKTKQLAIQKRFYHFKLNSIYRWKNHFVYIQWIVNLQTVRTSANSCRGQIDWTESVLNYDLQRNVFGIGNWSTRDYLLLAPFILQSFINSIK